MNPVDGRTARRVGHPRVELAVTAAGKPLAADDVRDRLSYWARTYERDLDQLDQAVADALGVSRTDLRCLDVLLERPLTPTALARASGLTPATITSVVHRLCAAGYLLRSPHPDDGRRVELTLTPAFLRAMAALHGGNGWRVDVLLERYADGDIATLVRFFQERHELCQRHIAEVRETAPRRSRTREPRA